MIHHTIRMSFIFKIYRTSVKWKFHFWMVLFFYRPSSLTAIHVPNVLTIVACKKKLHLISSLSEPHTKATF